MSSPITTTIHDDTTHGSDSFPKWLLVTLVIFSLAMITWQVVICGGAAHIGDSWSYFQAWDTLKTLHPHYSRPPIYPILIGATTDLMGQQAGYIAILFIQWGIWGYGCWCMWHILRYFNVSCRLSACTVTLMMVFPGAWMTNDIIQTECVAEGLIPVLVWLAIRYLRKRKMSSIIYSGLLLVTLFFLKPQFIYIIPIWIITWVYITAKNRRHLAVAVAVASLSTGLLLFYQWSLWHCYRQKTISTISSVNSYFGMRAAGVVKVDEIEDSVYREILRPLIEADPGTDMPNHGIYWFETRLPADGLERIWRNAYRLHTAEANSYILRRIPQSLTMSIFTRQPLYRPADTPVHIAYYKALGIPPTPPIEVHLSGASLFKVRDEKYDSAIYPMHGILEIPFWVAWLTMVAFTVWYIAVWRKRRRFPVIAFYIATLLWGGYATVFLGAPGEWGRLVTPLTTLLFVAGGCVVSNVKKTLSGRGLWRRGFA